MSLLTRLTEQVRSFWQGPLNSRDPELAKWFGGSPSSTGVSVSEETALTYSAFWACTYGISTDVGSVPLFHYKRLKEGGKERYSDSKLYEMLHDEPNEEMGAMTMRQALTGHVLTWGNGYAEIQRDGAGRPAALWPLTPNRVQPYRAKDARGRSGPLRYRVFREGGDFDELPASEMFHIAGLGFDGVMGYSVVTKARESIGLGLATERFGGTFFGNGAMFGDVFVHPQNLSKEVKQQFRDSVNEVHGGVDKANRFMILGGGIKIERRGGIPPNDAQFLETRQWQVEEICRWFRMPPHKIQHLLRSTNNNIEHQGIEYYIDTLRPWCVRWEQECNRKLIPRLERRIQFVEHLVDGVYRGDLQSRYAAYAVGRQWGWLSVDDIRERENMNPLPNGQGKIYLVPMNMTPADKIGELVDAQITKAKTPPPAPQPPGEPAQKDDTQAEDDAKKVRAALEAAETRAAELLAKAVALETENTLVKSSAEEQRAEIEQARTAAVEAGREVAALKALHLEAVERVERERAEREALAAAFASATAATGEQIATVTTRAVTAETAKDEAEAERDRLQARMLELEQTYACAQTTIAVMEIASQRHLVDGQQLADLEIQLDALKAVREVMATELETARQAVAIGEAKLTEAATARDTIAADLAKAQEAERQRQISLVAAHRALIVDAMERLIRKETDRARRNQATPAKLKAWAESFYLTHEETCLDALRPAMRTHLAAIGSTEDVDTVTRSYLQPQLAEAQAQIRIVADGDPEDFPVTLEKVLTRWEQDRPAAIADAVQQKEIAHVGTR